MSVPYKREREEEEQGYAEKRAKTNGEGEQIGAQPAPDATDTTNTSSNQQQTNEDKPLEVRVLISNYEAGIVIGKAGANVQGIRGATSCFVSVLKSEGEARDRVMSIKGTAEGVAQALQMIAELWVKDGQEKEQKDGGSSKGATADNVTFRMLVHKFVSGCLIGKAGAIAKDIVTTTGCRLQVSSDPVGLSTEKTATLSGPIATMRVALDKVMTQLIENPLRPTNNAVNYVPGRGGVVAPRGGPAAFLGGQNLMRADFYGVQDGRQGYEDAYGRRQYPAAVPAPARAYGGVEAYDPYGQQAGYRQQAAPYSRGSDSDIARQGNPGDSLQKIAIPTACAGAVIGKGGSIISDIKRQSGCVIRIADPEPTTPNERIVTVLGSPQGIQTAIMLMRQRVEQPQVPWGSQPQQVPVQQVPAPMEHHQQQPPQQHHQHQQHHHQPQPQYQHQQRF